MVDRKWLDEASGGGDGRDGIVTNSTRINVKRETQVEIQEK